MASSKLFGSGRSIVHGFCVIAFCLLIGFLSVERAWASSATQADNSLGTQADVDAIKKTFQDAMAAIINEDAVAAKACIWVQKEEDSAYVDATTQGILAQHHIGKVALARFGADAKVLSNQGVIFDDFLQQQVARMAAGKVHFNSKERAELLTLDGHGKKDFRKTDDGWRIENGRFSTDEQRDAETARLLEETLMMQQFASDIESGVFKNAQEAEAAYVVRRKALRTARMAKGTTRPDAKQVPSTQPNQ